MHKFTKYIIIAAAVLVVVGGGIFAFERYGYNHPIVKISFYTSGEGDVNVYTIPQIHMEARTSMGASEEWDVKYFEVYDIIDKMMTIAKSHASDEPYFFDSTVENVGGRTVFTLDGYYTSGGKKTDVHEEYSLDYVVTEDIAEH